MGSMARLWSCGFELQSVTSGVEWDTTTGSPTINTTTKRSGAAALRTNPTSAAHYITKMFSTNTNYLTNYVRFYLYITTAPSVTTAIMMLTSNATYELLSIRLTSTRTLQLYNEFVGTQMGSSSSALNTGQWYRIEVRYNYNNLEAQAYVDGTLFASSDQFYGYANDPPNNIKLGIIDATTADIYFDDVAVNDNTGSYQKELAGPGSIVHIYPDSAGDINECLSGDYTSIDDKPTPDDATTYAVFDTVNDDLLVNCESSSTAGIPTSAFINVVQVGCRVRSSTGASFTFVPKIESQASGTLLSGSSISQTSTTWYTNGSSNPKVYSLTSYVDPQVGGPWTPTLLDSAQIGGTTTAISSNCWLTSMWMLVEYTENAYINKSETATVTESKTVYFRVLVFVVPSIKYGVRINY